jgi:anti-sigma B factor antagonist
MSPTARSTVDYALRNWDAGRTRAHVVAASGELDLQAAPELRDLLVRLTELGVRDFVVDLSDATFVDSTTIGVLTGRLRHLHAVGGSLALVCTNAHVLRTLEISGMARVFEIHSTLVEALERGRSDERP